VERVIFTISSFLCGVAPSLYWLVFFRVLQGLGGGGLQPVSQAIIIDAFPPEKRSQATAVFSISAVIAPAWDRSWRVGYRQLLLALDLLHQHTHWDSRLHLELAFDPGPAASRPLFLS